MGDTSDNKTDSAMKITMGEGAYSGYGGYSASGLGGKSETKTLDTFNTRINSIND